jgi:hypothetical protein
MLPPEQLQKAARDTPQAAPMNTPKFSDALDFRKVTGLTSTRYPQYFLIIAVDYNPVNA